MVEFTKEYIGGMLAGFGAAVFFARLFMGEGDSAILNEPLVIIGGFALIVIGGMLARKGQQDKKRQTNK